MTDETKNNHPGHYEGRVYADADAPAPKVPPCNLGYKKPKPAEKSVWEIVKDLETSSKGKDVLLKIRADTIAKQRARIEELEHAVLDLTLELAKERKDNSK